MNKISKKEGREIYEIKNKTLNPGGILGSLRNHPAMSVFIERELTLQMIERRTLIATS